MITITVESVTYSGEFIAVDNDDLEFRVAHVKIDNVLIGFNRKNDDMISDNMDIVIPATLTIAEDTSFVLENENFSNEGDSTEAGDLQHVLHEYIINYTGDYVDSHNSQFRELSPKDIELELIKALHDKFAKTWLGQTAINLLM